VDDNGDRAVGRRRQRDDQFGAGEPGRCDRVALHAPARQRHRNAGQPIARWLHGQRGHHAGADIGQHVGHAGTGGPQQSRGQADAGQQRHGRECRTALLEDHGQVHPAEWAVVVGLGEFGPAEVDDRLPHRAPALRIRHGLSRGRGRAFGAQDVAHAVAQRQLSGIQSDVHKAPNIVKIVN
jgi:hypothetical protein